MRRARPQVSGATSRVKRDVPPSFTNCSTLSVSCRPPFVLSSQQHPPCLSPKARLCSSFHPGIRHPAPCLTFISDLSSCACLTGALLDLLHAHFLANLEPSEREIPLLPLPLAHCDRTMSSVFPPEPHPPAMAPGATAVRVGPLSHLSMSRERQRKAREALAQFQAEPIADRASVTHVTRKQRQSSYQKWQM